MPFVVGPEEKLKCADTDGCENSYPGNDCKGGHTLWQEQWLCQGNHAHGFEIRGSIVEFHFRDPDTNLGR